MVIPACKKRCAGLSRLDAGLPRNPQVRITGRRGGWITVSPLRARPDPESIEALKAEVAATWPMTRLLDIVKETDLRLGFTDALGSPTAYETLDRDELRPWLLLCLYGFGTNTGLRRLDATRDGGPSYRDLAYARRRYLTPDRLREAIAAVTNGTLRTRDPVIWGGGTTACASDSKHFGAPPRPPGRVSCGDRIDRLLTVDGTRTSRRSGTSAMAAAG